MKLYVGNLAFATTSDNLKEHFSQFGNVEDSFVASDRDTGRSRGFGFVTFTEADAANSAIEATNGQDFMGRKLVVNEARPAENRGGGGGSRGGYGGGNSGGGYGGNSGGGYGGGRREGGGGGNRW